MTTPAEALSAKKASERKPAKSTRESHPPVVACCLRELRGQLRLTIQDVAVAAGMSPAGYHAVERGRDVQMTTAFKLAKFFGKSVSEIWQPLGAESGRTPASN